MKKYIILFLAVLLLPAVGVAEEIPSFYDCADLSQIIARSEKLTATPHTDEEKSFTDDFSFIQRTSLSAEWLVYKIPSGNTVTVSTYFWDGDALSHFNFYLSEDGETFYQVKPTVKIHPKIDGKWLTIDYKIKNPDSSYIKIEFQNLSGNSWNPALRSVKCEIPRTNSVFYDVTDETVLENLMLLNRLGILSGYEDGSFKPADNVTRSSFVASVVKFMNMAEETENYGGHTYFADVPANAWYTPYVNFALSAGLIDMNSEKLFNPDNTVSYAEAVKMLLSALGYRQYAEAKGGWPLGYISVAEDLKLGKNCDKGAVLRGTLAILLGNGLKTPVLRQQSFGDDVTYLETDSAIYSYFKVTKLTSKILDNGITSVTGNTSVNRNEVILGYERYLCYDEAIKDTLGHTVTAYINENDEIIYFTDKTEDITIIDSDEITGFDNTAVKTEDNAVKVTPNTRIIYNGEFLSAAADCDLEEYKPNDGTVKIIGSPAEIISITSYETLVTTSSGVLGKSVFGRFTGEQEINIDDCLFVSLIRDGEKTDDFSYNADEVIQIARSLGGKSAKIVITTDAVIGEVLAVGDNMVIINGKEYMLSPHYYITSAIKSGESGYFLQDRNGKIVWGDITSSPFENYGYVIKCGNKEDVSGERQIKILTENGKPEIFTLDTRSDVPAENTVIKYRKSADNKIRQTKTLTADYKSSNTYHNSLFASLYSITAETTVFFIPEDKEYDDGYLVRKKNFLAANKRYNVELYGINGDFEAELAIIHQRGSELSKLSNYTAISVVTDVSVTITEKDDEVYRIKLQDGRELNLSPREIEDITPVSYCRNKKLHPNDTGNTIAVGDILQLATDENGDINAVRFLFTPAASNYYEWVSGEWGAVAKDNFFGETAVFYGKIEEKRDGRLIAKADMGWLRNLSLSGTSIFKLENGKLKSCDFSELYSGDEIACGILAGGVKILIKIV